MKSELQLLKEANDILRSISAIIDRKGETTNWEGISKKVKMALAEQHELLLAKNCYIAGVNGWHFFYDDEPSLETEIDIEWSDGNVHKNVIYDGYNKDCKLQPVRWRTCR